MSDEIAVKGLAELQRFLDAFPPKVERNIMRSALRAGAMVLRDAAREEVNSQSGQLARSLRVSTRARAGLVTASVVTRVFYARFVEYGTKPHTITGRDGGSLNFGGVLRKSVEHPGIVNPRPFMRPALDTRGQAAIVAVGEQVKRRLTKAGIEMPDILVEGDQ